MNNIKKKFLSKIYHGYGFKFYPKEFKKNFDLEYKFNDKKNKKFKIYNKKNRDIFLVLHKIKVNPNNIWNSKYFKDREDLSSLHRWTWAVKMISEKKKIKLRKKKFY